MPDQSKDAATIAGEVLVALIQQGSMHLQGRYDYSRGDHGLAISPTKCAEAFKEILKAIENPD